MNTKIIVCCHKNDIMARTEPYLPIHVGKALHTDVNLNIQSDAEGENISSKNNSYCELTGLYWAWKNLKNVDVIGLCHYRRYFDFHGQCKTYLPITPLPTSCFDNVDLSIPDSIINKVRHGAVVVAKEERKDYPIGLDYCWQHLSDDYRVMTSVINEFEDDKTMRVYTEFMLKNHYLIHYNMFIMRWSDFDQYCRWIFGLLEKIEAKIDISSYSPVQKRIFGYMAERLFNVWLISNNKELIKKPVIWFNDDANKPESFAKHLILKYRAKLGYLFSNPLNPYENRYGK